MSLLKEFVNQSDLKKSDGSDAGKTDVAAKAPAADVKFSLMRNTINSDGQVSGSDVANYLEKAHDINDEVDTVVYGLETSDGEVVKVYVNATQADAFEAEMKKLLGMEDDIEEAINDLATRFDIVDVVWPKGTGPEEDEDGDQNGGELDLDTGADLGDPANDAEVAADAPPEEEDEMEVIASADDTPAPAADDEDAPATKKPAAKKTDGDAAADEVTDADATAATGDEAEDDEDELDADGAADKKDKKPAKDEKKGDKHGNLKNVGKNMKVGESKLQVGWYVYDKDDKTVAGPVEEAEAKKICKQKGGDAKGFITGYVSDYDARRANENQEGTQMTIGDKFLKRVLAEGALHEADKEDRDGVPDGEAIPMDTQHRVLANKLKWRLPKQVVQLFAMVGIPGVRLNSADAETSIAEAAEMLREQLSVRRAFLDFFKAYAAAKGYDIKAAAPVQEGKLDEAKLKRGNALQKQLETVLVKLGLPEDLVSTTGPGIVGTALYRASKDIEDNADLKAKLRMLAIRMGLKPADFNAPLGEPVAEAVALNLGAGQEIDYMEQLIKALQLDTVFNVQDVSKTRRALQGVKLPPQALPLMKRLITVLGGQTPQQARQQEAGSNLGAVYGKK